MRSMWSATSPRRRRTKRRRPSLRVGENGELRFLRFERRERRGVAVLVDRRDFVGDAAAGIIRRDHPAIGPVIRDRILRRMLAVMDRELLAIRQLDGDALERLVVHRLAGLRVDDADAEDDLFFVMKLAAHHTGWGLHALDEALDHVGLNDHRWPCRLGAAGLDEAESGGCDTEREKLA